MRDDEIPAHWSPGLKLAYVVICLVGFTVVMLLIAKYIANPFATWGGDIFATWPLWLQIALLVSIFPIWIGLYWFRHLRHGRR